MAIQLEAIQTKMKRLFKLTTRNVKHLSLDEVMANIQDGNKDWTWFKHHIGDYYDLDALIPREDFEKMLIEMMGDIKKWSTSIITKKRAEPEGPN